MKRNKKSQTELIGIAIIVLLAIMLFLFAIAFFSGIKKSPYKPIEDRKIINSFLASIVQSTTMCQQYPLKQLIEDCTLGAILSCPENSCDYIKSYFDASLQHFFEGRQYYFSITEMKDVPIEISNTPQNKPCTGEKEAKNYPIYIRGFPITIYLELCR